MDIRKDFFHPCASESDPVDTAIHIHIEIIGIVGVGDKLQIALQESQIGYSGFQHISP